MNSDGTIQSLPPETAVDLVEAMPLGIYVTTRAGQVLYANAAIRRMLLIPDDAGLLDISPVERGTFDPLDRERFWNLLESEGEVRGFEVQFTRYDGRRIDVVLNARLRPGSPNCCEGSAADISERKAAERALDGLNRMLMEATREAGMAEAAGDVIHKAGNILTSVNLTVHDLRDRVRESGITNLGMLADRLSRERDRLPEFLTGDPVGRQLPDLLLRISDQLSTENASMAEALENLDRHCGRIRECIVNQAARAGAFESLEQLEIEPLVAIVLRLEGEAGRRAGIAFESRIEQGLTATLDRLKIVQILLCLVSHFREVAAQDPHGPRRAVVAARRSPPWLLFSVTKHDAPAPALPGPREAMLAPNEAAHPQNLQRCIIAARATGGALYALPEGGCLFRLRAICAGAHSNHEP